MASSFKLLSIDIASFPVQRWQAPEDLDKNQPVKSDENFIREQMDAADIQWADKNLPVIMFMLIVFIIAFFCFIRHVYIGRRARRRFVAAVMRRLNWWYDKGLQQNFGRMQSLQGNFGGYLVVLRVLFTVFSVFPVCVNELCRWMLV